MQLALHISLPLIERQPNDKGRPPPLFSLKKNLSPVLFPDDGMTDGQPLSGTLAYLLGGEKGIEHLGTDGFGDTHTRILDPDFHMKRPE